MTKSTAFQLHAAVCGLFASWLGFYAEWLGWDYFTGMFAGIGFGLVQCVYAIVRNPEIS